jgi:hypothetical protein
MTTDVRTTQPSAFTPSRRAATFARVACGVGAGLAAAAVLVLGEGITATDTSGLSRQFTDQAGAIMLAAVLATYAAAALSIAAVRVSRTIPGDAGRVAGYAGAATILLLALYYGSFAAGSIVGADLLVTPDSAAGEAALVTANMIEFGRYATGLALVLAVAVAYRRIPKSLAISAALLSVIAATPFTAWVAAILIPIWLGVAGALVRPIDDPSS